MRTTGCCGYVAKTSHDSMVYAYMNTLTQALHSRNYLDWMRELETRLKMKNVNQNIMSIAIAKNALLDNIMELADREVDGTLTCEFPCVLATEQN